MQGQFGHVAVAHPVVGQCHSRSLTVADTVIPHGQCLAQSLSADSHVEHCLSELSVPCRLREAVIMSYVGHLFLY